MHYIKLIFLFIIIVSCSNEQRNTTIYPKGIFTYTEEEEIAQMLNEFTTVICKKKKPQNSVCIKEFFERHWGSFERGKILDEIDSVSLERILEPLSEELKDKLFIERKLYYKHRIPNTTPTLMIRDTISYLFINVNETYMTLLNHLSQKYSSLKEVEASIERMGDLVPTDYGRIYSKWEGYDYSESSELLYLSYFIISDADNSIKKRRSYRKVIGPIEQKLKEKHKYK